ncbi:hypothetical protein NP233_g5036 [Leucocoprinus birnbaumii]|uniref:Uncharacterized protein n=1 Tax=Leucocoprinus birnbaumii TaxID=56174 RepID=A0AAD5VTN4_9AGAR|nr:hypothetical protein NP233_g5036 [Leucocoprinus birnbaumii]
MTRLWISASPTTIMDGSVSSSASSYTIHGNFADHPAEQHSASISASAANSPPSSALPSPPDSPSSDSVSSFPSVSSSFFFSSAAASPPHPPHSEHLTEGLIIPSLTLPTALRRPTAYGKSIGDLRLLMLGSRGAGKTFLTSLLLEDNDAVVEVGNWEETEYGKVLYASTDWIEHSDAHGLEKYEPTRNIEILELPGYHETSDGAELADRIMAVLHSPFRSLSDVLNPVKSPSSLVANLLSSSATPLFTAMIFLLPSAPTSLDRLLINQLGTQIPLVILPRLQSHSTPDSTPITNDKLSAFRPSTAVALRSGLFSSPETLALLRSEATDRFLRWREVERTVSHIHQPHVAKEVSDWRRTSNETFGFISTKQKKEKWDKAKWESEYLASFSHDVAKRNRGGTITRRQASHLNLELESFDHHGADDEVETDRPDTCAPLDPLHLPSLFLFSISLLNPLRARLKKSISDFLESLGSERNVRVALFGIFRRYTSSVDQCLFSIESLADSKSEKSSVTSSKSSRKVIDEPYLEKGVEEGTINASSPAPDGGWRAWSVVLGVWIMQFVTFGYTNAYGVYNDFYVREYLSDYQSSQISWIGSVQLFLLLTSGLFSGRAFDAGHFHKVMLGGAALFVFCLFMLSITHAQQYYQVLLAHGLGIGLAAGVTYVPGLAVISHWFQKRRPVAIGLVTSGSAVGGFVHPIMLNQLFHGPLGFHNGVRVSAAMNAGLLIVALLLIRTRLPPTGASQNMLVSYKTFLRDPAYSIMVIGTVLVLAGLYYPFFFIQLNAIKNGVNATLAFYTVAIINGASVVGRIIPNLLVRRFGAFNVVVTCILSSAILVFCTLAVKDTAGTVVFSILFGFFSGSYAGMLAPMVGSLAETDKEIGARLGVCFTFTGKYIAARIIVMHKLTLFQVWVALSEHQSLGPFFHQDSYGGGRFSSLDYASCVADYVFV